LVLGRIIVQKQSNQPDGEQKSKKPVGRRVASKRVGTWRLRQGQWTELRFMSEATQRGFNVLQPCRKDSVYDVVLDEAQQFPRVQVKSVGRPRRPEWARGIPGAIYIFNTRRHGHKYRAGDLDFYALYIIPRDLWYIIPYRAIGPVQVLYVYPDNPQHRMERYREAWNLLRQDSGPLTLHASVGSEEALGEKEETILLIV
jgi:hypothetical protein